ncbi:Fn3 associated [Prevotellaceae bacterium HUN156]|nr:Fn3 associated [Prevotellaceae bacterium HUN156]
MKRKHIKMLLFCSLLLIVQAAWADGVKHLAFLETFDATNGTGGNDNQFSGNIASSKIQCDQEGWSSTKCGGANQCLKFGTGSEDGVCTTPQIILLGKQGVLYFDAAGWASGQKTLEITANEGVTLSGETTFVLDAGSWNTNYCIHFTLESATYLQLTFTGRRGFLDNIRVEEDVTAINAPTLPDEYLFWPKTTETATTNITLIPSDSTTVYYTTDGTEPSETNGNIATLTTNFMITGTTTVKARAYYQGIASDLVSKTYTEGETVNSITAFKAKNEGDEVRLFIPYDSQARVLHGQDGKAYLYDNTGPLCLDFGTTATFNPMPKDNQHVAGWIIGKKQTADGLLKLVATSNTNTNHLALADRVSEPNIAPTEIEPYAGISNLIGGWVKGSNIRCIEDYIIDDTNAYDRALVDVSGIVTASNTITPMRIMDNRPLTFVIDEDKEFFSPAEDLRHVTVRLKRTLKANQWNTFCIPMDLPCLEGLELRKFSEVNGNVMHFENRYDIEAGMPYLAKPIEDFVDPVLDDVTLASQSARNVGDNDFEFKATYSPMDLETDKTELFLTSSGKLAYPSSEGTATIKGLRAYFKVPAGADARLNIDGIDTSLELVNDVQCSMSNVQYYDLQGRKVSNPAKGIYISNHKKVVIK